MVFYAFDGTKSVFKTDTAEATVIFKKVSEIRVDISVEMKHYETNTYATFKKYVVVTDNGFLMHYPIKQFAVDGIIVGKHDTIKKYFTHILGEKGYRKFRENFLEEFSSRQELELDMLLGIE